jgi:hypothetical protein
MKRSGPKFSELSPALRAVAVLVGTLQVALFVAAQADITRRPASQLRGSKAKWRAICLLNTVGPLSYFRWGRVRNYDEGLV